MSDLTCPYCEDQHDYDGDWDFAQDSGVEITCPNCGKIYIASANYHVSWGNESKAPCLNGAKHEYEKVCRVPAILFGSLLVRCKWCSVEKNVLPSEAEKYGYTRKFIDESIQREVDFQKACTKG
jgi:hypothetical protein